MADLYHMTSLSHDLLDVSKMGSILCQAQSGHVLNQLLHLYLSGEEAGVTATLFVRYRRVMDWESLPVLTLLAVA